MEKNDFGLYTYKYKAFNIDSSDEEDANTAKTSLFDSFASKKKKRSRAVRKNGTTQENEENSKSEVIEVSDDEEFIRQHKSRIIEEEEETMLRTSSIESAKLISQTLHQRKVSPAASTPSSVVAAAHNVLSEHLRKAREYYERFRSLDRILHVSEPVLPPHEPQPDPPSVVIPQIKTAAERAEERRKRFNAPLSVAVDLVNSDTSLSVQSPPAVSEQRVRLKTRLNGHHEWLWKPARSDTFLKLKEKFAEIYGLPLDGFVMKFENEALGNDETPESLDLEDDDLIEVKLSLSQNYDAAVASANSYKTRLTRPASVPEPTAIPAASTAAGAREIRVIIPGEISATKELDEVVIKVLGKTTVEKIVRGVQNLARVPDGHRLGARVIDRETASPLEAPLGDELAYAATMDDIDVLKDPMNGILLILRDAIDVFITLSFAEDAGGNHPVIKVILKPHNTWQETMDSISQKCRLDDGEILQLHVGEVVLDPQHRVGDDLIVKQGCNITCLIVD